MDLTLMFVSTEAIGYGRYGVRLADELEKMGVDIYQRADDRPTVGTEHEGKRFKRTNVVAYVSVPTHARGWYAGQVPVLSSMWESTSLPESFRENLHEFDTVIVPSDQNVELFGKYHPNVVKVPLGVDPETWCYRKRRAPATRFNFLIGGSGHRKGTDVAYKAFRKLWPTPGSWGDGPEPWLTFKSPKPEEFYGARIERVPGRISPEDEVALYANAHCYLQPSRGEGFGLQPLQAIAQGCPTILTNAHGHADFAHLGMGLSTTLTKAGYFIYGDAGDWWEPDLDELCDWMLWTYENYEVACDKATTFSDMARERFTWHNTARSFVEAIGSERLEAPYSGDGSWYKPVSRLYHTRVTVPWQADIAGITYQFQPGVNYWEPADVKRIMFDAGLLDPACTLGDNHGLSPAQTERAELYRAEKAYCEMCHQRLGSGVTKADELAAV